MDKQQKKCSLSPKEYQLLISQRITRLTRAATLNKLSLTEAFSISLDNFLSIELSETAEKYFLLIAFLQTPLEQSARQRRE